MKVLLLLAVVALLDVASLVAAKDIIVLVHGLAGWGEKELGTFRYWGQWFYSNPLTDTGRNNVVKRLKDATGLEVYVAQVGPFSSNHERACEVYAMIRGLRTDYGEKRATLTQSQRYAPAGSSMDFPSWGGGGWLPNWGLAGNTDRVHLVGHSMGAPTVRMLEHLMRFGKADEAGTSGMSELFRTDVNRLSAIKSLTTISGVNDGSTLHAKLGGAIVNTIKNLLIDIGTIDAAFTWNGAGVGSLYNFDLDRLGLTKLAGEGFSDYTNRLMGSAYFASSYTYLAHYDLSPGFMFDFNTIPGTYRAYPEHKYLAVSTSRTGACTFWPWDQCAGTWMEAILQPTANIIGNMDGVCDVVHPSICFGDGDEENDGLVSRVSTRGPHNGALLSGTTNPTGVPQKCNFMCITTSDDWAATKKGQWYYTDFSYDHLQAVGFQITGWTGPFQDPVGDIYVGKIAPFILST